MYPSTPAQEYPAKPPPMGFQPPPPAYYPMTQSQPAATNHPIVFGPESITMVCPHCQCMMSSETSRTHKTCTHCCCLFLFCTIGCSLFSCLPYFFCDPDSVDHTCPNCKVLLGTWHSD